MSQIILEETSYGSWIHLLTTANDRDEWPDLFAALAAQRPYDSERETDSI